MPRRVSWKQVSREALRIFSADRPSDDFSALLAFALFQKEALARDLSAEEALQVLLSPIPSDFTDTADNLRSASIAAVIDRVVQENRDQDITAQIQKLTNLEESSARIESTLSRLNAVADKLEKTSGDIDARTIGMATTIENRVVLRIEEAAKHAIAAAANTSLKATVKAAVITSAISATLIGIPANMLSSYLYDANKAGSSSSTQRQNQSDKSSDPPKPPQNVADSIQAVVTLFSKRDSGSVLRKPHAPVMLAADAYGVRSIDTGKSMIELLKDGQTVLLPTKNGVYSVCLKPNVPIVCKPQQLNR